MNIFAVADEPDDRIWDHPQLCTELKRADVILSAGDLPASYLSFLTCFTHAPVLYVHGNHDDRYEKEPPEGCICIEDDIYTVNGVRILGLGGSMRYRLGGCMYTEEEMRRRIRRLRRKIRKNGGFDILLAHAPIRGVGDQEDLAHRGFECFEDLIDTYHPALVIHGHIHASYTHQFVRERSFHDARVINAGSKIWIEQAFASDPSVPTDNGSDTE